MQDNQHQTPEHPDDASDHPASGIVRVEPESVFTLDASPALPQPPPPSLGDRLVQQVKGHAQLLIGAWLGVITTLFFSQAHSTPSSPLTVHPLGLNETLLVQAHPWRFTGVSDGSMPNLLVSPPPAPPSSPQPQPRLTFMDRYYFAAAETNESTPGTAGWLMVDRFYFSPMPDSTASSAALPNVPLASSPSTVAASQAVLPPAHDWANFAPQFHGVLEVPPPPQMDFLSPEAQPLPELPQSGTATYPLDAHHRGLHSLLGVVQTNHFGAALIKTQDSSYSVRVGEPIRQSNLTLAELDRDRVILTDGQRQLVVNVGETF